MIRFLLLLLLFTFSLNATLLITNERQKYENFNISYLYDETSSLGIQEIQNKKFTTEIDSQFTEGYKLGNAWFKIELQNNSQNEEFVLYFTESIWSDLNLYSYQNDKWNVKKNGLNTPLKMREIQDSSPAFHLRIDKGQTAVYYVKGNTIASQIGEFQLYTSKEYFNPDRMTMTQWYIIYAFVLLAFVLLNVYNYLATKEDVYVYYVVYVLVYIIFSSMHSGTYIAFGFPNWHEGLHVLGSLTLLTLLQFSIEFLELKSTYPLMKRVFNYLSLVSLFIVILLALDVRYSSPISNVFFSSTLIFIVYVAVAVLKRGFDGAKYYLIALMFYLPSLAMMAMDFNTILPNTDITRYSFLAGAFVEIFFFTVILTNRYKVAIKEKLLAQDKLLQEQNDYQVKLISEIEKKTEHLTIANERLTQQTQELEESKKRLTIEATTDMLSGLYNRRYFFEASQQSFYTALRYDQKLSVMMLDIDHFKSVNDTYGHIFGDKVIRTSANILKETSRDSDIVARYGGEEFIALLPHTNIQEATYLADRIRENFQAKNILLDNDKIVNITISIGVTELDTDNDVSIENAILRCDKALYEAKETGRNRVCSL